MTIAPLPELVGELQDSRLDMHDVGATLSRLSFAEDQIVAQIAGAYRARREAGSQYLMSDEEVARIVVESPMFRFWIGVLAGYDTRFLQKALGR